MATRKPVYGVQPGVAPLDVKRCQAEKPNGASFMTFGGVPGLVRCSDEPTFVIVERVADKKGVRGAMTLCAACFEVFKRQEGIEKILVYPILRPEKEKANVPS